MENHYYQPTPTTTIHVVDTTNATLILTGFSLTEITMNQTTVLKGSETNSAQSETLTYSAPKGSPFYPLGYVTLTILPKQNLISTSDSYAYGQKNDYWGFYKIEN